MARALNSWWVDLGRPDPFTVVEAGAGPGTLARSVLAAAPECGGALRYVMVERSAALRRRHPQGAESLASLPDEPFNGVVLANELLDNLAFRILVRDGARTEADGWAEVYVDAAGREVLLDAPPNAASEADRLAPDAAEGARIPLQHQAGNWLGNALGLVQRGRVVVVDYADTTPALANRPWTEWVRTYRRHGRGGHPGERPGETDITCEVAIDQLAAVVRPPDFDRSQAEFLRTHGIDEMVAAAREEWHARAHIGDLPALVARSRVSEAAALTDPTGLGAFRVLEWRIEP